MGHFKLVMSWGIFYNTLLNLLLNDAVIVS